MFADMQNHGIWYRQQNKLSFHYRHPLPPTHWIACVCVCVCMWMCPCCTQINVISGSACWLRGQNRPAKASCEHKDSLIQCTVRVCVHQHSYKQTQKLELIVTTQGGGRRGGGGSTFYCQENLLCFSNSTTRQSKRQHWFSINRIHATSCNFIAERPENVMHLLFYLFCIHWVSRARVDSGRGAVFPWGRVESLLYTPICWNDTSSLDYLRLVFSVWWSACTQTANVPFQFGISANLSLFVWGQGYKMNHWKYNLS